MDAFLLADGGAALVHAACFAYVFTDADVLGASIPVDLVRVAFGNTTEANRYYRVHEVLSFSMPSVAFLHGVVAFVTALAHVFVYFPVHARLRETVWCRRRALSLRWVEYSITCTIMTIASALSSGTSDLNYVVGTACTGVCLQAMGFAVEQTKATPIWRFFFAVGCVLELGLAWTVVWNNLSSVGGSVHHWIETAVYMFYYGLFALNCFVDAAYAVPFYTTDWVYTMLSLTSKVAFFWIQIGDVDRKIHGESPWTSVQIYVLGCALPLVLLCAGVVWRPRSVDVGRASAAPPNGYVSRLDAVLQAKLL